MKDAHLVWARRQYTGTTERIENAKVMALMTYAGRHGHTMMGRRLPPAGTGTP